MSTMEDHKCYIGVADYQKLPPCHIRLIVLFAGDSDKPLEARLESRCLNRIEDNDDSYAAVSYTWSSEERIVPMVLNGKPIEITKNLGELFQEARKVLLEDQYSLWWVDQLCINQDDDEDKVQQVPHMRAIYEKAGQTLVWLRPAFEDSALVVDLVRRLYDLSRLPESGFYLEQLSLPEILGPPSADNLRAWRALNDLMSHRYWTRTWILPEATAKVASSVVACDTLQNVLSIQSVFWMRNLLRQLSTRSSPPEYRLEGIPSSLVGRVENFAFLRVPSQARHATLFDLLFITRRTRCTRPEDKIFSMLPFAVDVGDYVNDRYIKPSYVNGCRSTYIDLVKWYVTKYRNLNFLGSCTATKDWTSQYTNFDLPSWVPNWTHASYIQPLPKYCNSEASVADRTPLYNACGPFSHSINIFEIPSIEFLPDKLFVSGLRIATIHKALEPVSDGGYWQADTELSWQDEFDHSAEYPLTKESYLDAFERTIVADVARNAENEVIGRPGKVKWWHGDAGLDLTESNQHERQLKFITGDRRLMFAKSISELSDVSETNDNSFEEGESRLGAGCASLLMGIGRSDVAIGDEIWALKGGQVLYVLRPRPGSMMVKNMADTPEPGWPSCPSMLWLNDKPYPWNASLSGPSYQFLGECYVHGLMDGEALDIASLQHRERPEPLKDMSSEFREIFVCGTLQ